MEPAFHFGEWAALPESNELIGLSGLGKLRPRVMELLVYLVENRRRVVSKEELLEKVWQGTFVTEEALTYTASELRKVLGDDAKKPRFLEMVARKGYRFIAPVSAGPPAEPSSLAAPTSGVSPRRPGRSWPSW